MVGSRFNTRWATPNKRHKDSLMHHTLQKVFDEHGSPTHASKRHVHDQLTPIVRLAAKAQQQVLEYRVLITEASLSDEHDPRLDGKLELMHQTFGAMERAASNLTSAARELAQATAQLDRYVVDWKADLARHDEMTQQQQHAETSNRNPEGDSIPPATP